ncbi:MAG: NRDE family protein [Actinobacteria bacterium]|nr:NRDE family protein [Actinomycetota bacterium]
MCLLVVLSRVHADFPLVVAANRDELLERPAVPMTVLRERDPRILGGKDELAGGTWLAVNEHGVVAGLTNRPMPEGRDTTKRSRGDLPLFLAEHTSAAAAGTGARDTLVPSDYNPCWLLVGDRTDLFAVDMTGAGAPLITELPPGVHILENRSITAPTPKTAHVRRLLDDIASVPGGALVDRLRAVMSDHQVPEGWLEAVGTDDKGREVPPEVGAPCVHTEKFGTRWSGIVTVPRGSGEAPTVRYADGPACAVAYADASTLW